MRGDQQQKQRKTILQNLLPPTKSNNPTSPTGRPIPPPPPPMMDLHQHHRQTNTPSNQENEAIQSDEERHSTKLHIYTRKRRTSPTPRTSCLSHKHTKLLPTGLGPYRDTHTKETGETGLHHTISMATYSTIGWDGKTAKQLPNGRHSHHVRTSQHPTGEPFWSKTGMHHD
jgi:hypothetical protein